MSIIADRHRPAPPDFESDSTQFFAPIIRYCPACASPVESGSLVQEFWTAHARNLDFWCGFCEVNLVISVRDNITALEPAGNPHDHS